MNHIFDHQVKFKRGNDPCSSELSYNFFLIRISGRYLREGVSSFRTGLLLNVNVFS